MEDGAVHDEALRRVVAMFDMAVMSNTLRGIYVEAQVGVLLGPTWEAVGGDWGPYDFRSSDGAKLEVKQSAARQSWEQNRPTKPVFDIRPRTGRYEGADWIPGTGRTADIYVFAWHPLWTDADQRDQTQWDYYVVPTPALADDRKTIGLSSRPHVHRSILPLGSGTVNGEPRSDQSSCRGYRVARTSRTSSRVERGLTKQNRRMVSPCQALGTTKAVPSPSNR